MGKSTPEPARRRPTTPAPAPMLAYEDRPRAQERVALLSLPSSGAPFAKARSPCASPSSNNRDLEAGRAAEGGGGEQAKRWQVAARFHACPWFMRRSGGGGACVVELVQLRGANFGVRWGGAALDPSAAASPPPRWMVGPHWYLMAATWSVFALLALFVTAVTLPKAGAGETVTGVLLSASCLLSYALVGLSDPGIVPPLSLPPDDSYTYCDQCESFRPEGALHCMDCRVCIAGYDHHCPWTGKCVGRGNARFFYVWLLLLVLAFVYEVIEFTTYMLPPTDQPVIDSSDDSFDVVRPSFAPSPVA